MHLTALLLATMMVLSGCSVMRDVSESLNDMGRQIGEALGLCCDREKRVEGPPVRLQWEGRFQATDLAVLPERADRPGTGLIADPETWGLVWKTFRPSEKVPAIDFANEFVAFARNLQTFGKVSLVHVAIGGNSMDLRWRMPADGPTVGTSVYIAFAVLRRGEFGLVRSLGHPLVLPPPPNRSDGGSVAAPRKIAEFANPNIEKQLSRGLP